MSKGFLQEFQFSVPVKTVEYDLTGKKPGLVIVDVVRGFCEPGCGLLAPPAPDEEIQKMVKLTNETARNFIGRVRPVLILADTHIPGVPEPPYPPHCEKGSGQEELMPELKWLEKYAEGDLGIYSVQILRKDCINGFVGGLDLSGRKNEVRGWINTNVINTLIVVGICTDICVLDLVVTLLSLRNHKSYGLSLVPFLEDIVVYVPACATYDLPRNIAESLLSLPPEAAHPRDIMNHMGLKIMSDRGAVLAHELTFPV